MNEREKLIKLLDECIEAEFPWDTNDYIADHLLANGVIIPPCKVGDTVYEAKGNGKIVKGIVESIHQNLVGSEAGRWIITSWFDNYYADSKIAGFECGTHLYSVFDDFGKTVFLTREEAEQALKATHSERCVVCGEDIPEGRQVCPKCEKGR